METLIHSFLAVTLTEMGDKTQLLALVLASRFRRPWTVMAGILVATVANHLLAASLGDWVARAVSPDTLRWVLSLSFVAFAIWVLIPDRHDESADLGRRGAFLTTVLTFFLAEMGDKTQLTTLALAARYEDIPIVTLGTTLGMLFSDGLAVFFGERITRIVPMVWIHRVAAGLFILFAIGLWISF